MISDTKSEKDLRTELVLNFHSDCNVFPFRSATSFPVTSSRLGVSSPCPTLSTRLKESDLGGNQFLLKGAMMAIQMCALWRLELTHRLVQAQMLDWHSSPTVCPF